LSCGHPPQVVDFGYGPKISVILAIRPAGCGLNPVAWFLMVDFIDGIGNLRHGVTAV
jgi:hypothetical protein